MWADPRDKPEDDGNGSGGSVLAEQSSIVVAPHSCAGMGAVDVVDLINPLVEIKPGGIEFLNQRRLPCAPVALQRLLTLYRQNDIRMHLEPYKISGVIFCGEASIHAVA